MTNDTEEKKPNPLETVTTAPTNTPSKLNYIELVKEMPEEKRESSNANKKKD